MTGDRAFRMVFAALRVRCSQLAPLTLCELPDVLQTVLPMKTLSSHHRFPRPVAGLCAAGLIVCTLLISGCATAVKVDSTPAGATVTIGGKTLPAKTPTEYQVENANKPVEVAFILEGYFPKNFTYLAGSSPQPITARLEPTRLRKSFEISTEPAGASVSLEGQPVGTTPVTVPVVFSRDSETAPWTPQRLTISKTDYQSETIVLTSELASVPTQNLGLLKDERVYNITAATPEGAVLNAPVTLDGAQKGKTPMKLPITYTRADKTKPWPKFTVTLEIPGQYKPATAELTYTRDVNVALKLIAITEIPVKIFAPTVRVTPTGAAFAVIERITIGTLRTSDDSSAVTDLKQVTTYDRQDRRDQNRIETINSFTVTPDGQNVIFSLTET
ncbi:MAG: PEGA domain-containing protein, partial [Verrucomicrobia bacterium]|nr:PEGA domain-containing protein [Verrucomicrobiota bacterium]